MQLPVYLYLAKEGLFKNAEVIGFYLQKILNNEIIRDPKKTYEQQKEENLKLFVGHTPFQVMIGGILGIIVALIFCS